MAGTVPRVRGGVGLTREVTAKCANPKLEVAKLLDKSEFGNFLECPVCLDIPLPPVYICATGHLICGNCRKRLKICGLCNGALSGARNFFYENIIERVTFNCRNANERCCELILGKDLKSHMETCHFRPVPCIKYGCPKMKEHFVTFSKYMEHFVISHGGKINKISRGKVCNGYPETADSWMISRWVHEAFFFKDKHFFAVCQIRKPEVGIWLWVLGNDDVAQNFRGVIILGDSSKGTSGTKGPQPNQTSLVWEGPVHSIRKSADEVMDSGECFITSMSNIKALCSRSHSSTKADARVFWEVQFEVMEKDLSSGNSGYRCSPGTKFRNVSTVRRATTADSTLPFTFPSNQFECPSPK